MSLTIEDLREIVEKRQYKAIQWEDEPHYTGDPLIIDLQTAHAMVVVYDAVNEVNKERFRKQLESRVRTIRLAEFVWTAVKYGDL